MSLPPQPEETVPLIDWLERQGDTVIADAAESLLRLSRRIEARPLTSLAIAFGIGLLFGRSKSR